MKPMIILILFFILNFSSNMLLRGDRNNTISNELTVSEISKAHKELHNSTLKLETSSDNSRQDAKIKEIVENTRTKSTIKLNNTSDHNTKESKFESVQIIKRDKLLDSKTPEYVKSESKDELKTATLLGYKEQKGGLTERPNFLSSVIRSHPTSVSTSTHLYQSPNDSTTYDLDSISEKHFNMNVEYPHSVIHPSFHLPDLSPFENKLNHLEKLDDRHLTHLITGMKNMKETLANQGEGIYKSINKYVAQNGVILDSLKDEEEDANRKLGGMIGEVNQNQREDINREIEDEFSRSLAGYHIDKDKYPHLKDLDPKELIEVSAMIKKDLDVNAHFFLHGDYSFYN